MKNVNTEKRDTAMEDLTALRGMFGACFYLMGHLEGEEADLELWLMDIRNRLDNVIEVVGEIA
jgi:hypothetical protein